MVLRDAAGNVLQAPTHYTGHGPIDRIFGMAIADSLETRATFHPAPVTIAVLGTVKPHSNSVAPS